MFINILIPLSVFTVQFDQPTRRFYLAVSPMYSIWAVCTLGLLPLEVLSYWLFRTITRKIKIKKCVTQKELEDVLRKPELSIAHKIPYLLGLLTVLFYFVGGIPFLILMMGPYFGIYYCFEKLARKKWFRNPKNLDDTPLRFADYIVVGILIMH